MEKFLKISLLLFLLLVSLPLAYANQYLAKNQVSRKVTKNAKVVLLKGDNISEEFYALPTRLNDTIPDSLRQKSKTKTMLLGIFTGFVGGHLWYLGYHRRAMKRTLDGVAACSLIGLGALGQFVNSSLLKNFSGYLVAIGGVILLKVLIQTIVELVGISKGHYPKEYREEKEETKEKAKKPSEAQVHTRIKMIKH